MTTVQVAFHDQCEAIAEALGEGWTAVPQHEHSVRLVGPEDVRLHCYTQQYGRLVGRVRITAAYWDLPGYEHGDSNGVSGAEMTAALSRGPAAIAADVCRRVLGTATQDRDTVLANISRRQADTKQREGLADELAQRIGNGANVRGGTDVYPGTANDWYGSLKVMAGGGRVSLDISNLPAEVALRVADALGRRR